MFSRHALNTEQQKLRIKSAVIGPSWTEIRITLYPMNMMLMVIIWVIHAYPNHDKFRPWCYSVSGEKVRKLLYF